MDGPNPKPGRLLDPPGIPVANRGIGSETTRGLLFRFNEDVLDLRLKVIVLLTGSNDLSALQDIQLSRSNIIAQLAVTSEDCAFWSWPSNATICGMAT